MGYRFSEITPEIKKLADASMEGYRIDPELYTEYDVKRGLRDINGKRSRCGSYKYKHHKSP